MELEQHYEKLAMWAIGVLNSHQLTTAAMIGLTAGLADLLSKQIKDGAKPEVADLMQYECMRAVINKRKEEVEVFAREINALHIPLPEVDQELAGQAVDEQYRAGYKLAVVYDAPSIKNTMDKIMKGVSLDTPIPDDPTED